MNSTEQLRPARLSTLNARRICIIKPSSLGDIVQSLPVLGALRARFPRSHIAWVANRTFAPLLEPIGLLDEVIEFDRARLHMLDPIAWRRGGRFLADLQKARFDLAIDLQGLLRSGVMCWATGAVRRIGLASAREGAALFYTDLVDDRRGEPNALKRYWRVAELLGVGHLPIAYPLDLSPSERSWARSRLVGLARPIVAISPGGRWPTKRWPAENFAGAARHALQGAGSLLIVGGADERRLWVDADDRFTGTVLDMTGRTSLRQLAALLEHVDLFFGNDSGPLHLASAVGTPTVSIFTCTAPERAAPLADRHRVVQTTVPCRASYRRCCDQMHCMCELSVDKVVPALEASLTETSSRRATTHAA